MEGRGQGSGIRGWRRIARDWEIETRGWVGLIVLAMAFTSEFALAQGSDGPAPVGNVTISLRLFDFARVERKTLDNAAAQAAAILRKAEIESDWLVCSVEDASMPPECSRPIQPGELVLRIVRRPEPVKGPGGGERCGAAIEDRDGRGSYSTFFADCLGSVSEVDSLLPSTVLAHLLVHEMGHLLLPGKDHSSRGIMKPVLLRADWKEAVVGALHFTAEETRLLRVEVLKRQQRPSAPVMARGVPKP